MQSYSIWVEGSDAIGAVQRTAWLAGIAEGDSFAEACHRWIAANKNLERYYSYDLNTFHGCYLHPSEEEAQTHVRPTYQYCEPRPACR